MNQTFGLANMWAQGDAVTRTVAIILLVMSNCYLGHYFDQSLGSL